MLKNICMFKNISMFTNIVIQIESSVCTLKHKNTRGNIIWALKQIRHGKLKILFGRLNKFFGL